MADGWRTHTTSIFDLVWGGDRKSSGSPGQPPRPPAFGAGLPSDGPAYRLPPRRGVEPVAPQSRRRKRQRMVEVRLSARPWAWWSLGLLGVGWVALRVWEAFGSR